MSCWKYVLSLYLLINKGLLKKYVRWGGEGGGGGAIGHWKANKNEQGEGGPSIYVRLLFKKKCWDFQNEVL